MVDHSTTIRNRPAERAGRYGVGVTRNRPERQKRRASREREDAMNETVSKLNRALLAASVAALVAAPAGAEEVLHVTN